MRLARIKLAGFKSFVDPTVLLLPGNRVGIVGPNGCGKSNTIDAVRWVMGESSAKHLRGDSSEDVIFNGSSSRKPVGQASIELFFDNSEGRLGGEYSSFAEISVRRQLTRDGQSKYFLNGQRARKRDVTDLFLGTGLGPRSYAIIEQGMISRLIEARPEELRVYLEEAAGISKYKERRRETENRIRHTRENLERLDDVREEVSRQAAKLTRQAEVAQRYQELAAERRQRRAELLLLRLRSLTTQLEQESTALTQAETELAGRQAEMQRRETSVEQLRQQRQALEQQLQSVQGAYYQAAAEVSRLEQSIRHAEAELEREARELTQLDQRLQEALLQLEQVQEKVALALAEIEERELAAEAANAALEEAELDLERADIELNAARDARAQWQQAMAGPQQQAQLARTQMDHADQLLQRARQRRQRLDEEAQRLPDDDGGVELAQAEAMLDQLQESLQQVQDRREQVREQLQERRQQGQMEQEAAHALERRAREISGQLASLKILPGLDRQAGQQALQSWASAAQVDLDQRVAAAIDVDPGWETAAEVVLAPWFDALLLPLKGSSSPQAWPEASLRALDPETAPVAIPDTSLAARVRAPAALQAMLARIYCCDDWNQAQNRLRECQVGESVITRDGSWLGAGWLWHRNLEPQVEGVFDRLRLERTLESESAVLAEQTAERAATLAQVREASRALEAELEDLEAAQREAQRGLSRQEATVLRLRERAASNRERRERVLEECAELDQEILRTDQQRAEALENRNLALQQLEGLTRDGAALEQRNRLAQEAQQTQRMAAQTARTRASAARLALQEAHHRVALEQGQQERLQQQRIQDQDRITRLQAARNERLAPLDGWRHDLAAQLQLRQTTEAELTAARSALDACDAQLRDWAGLIRELVLQVEQQRNQCEEQRLHLRELGVQRDQWADQLQETGFAGEELAPGLPLDATIVGWEENIASLDRKIERLGPINLAAIDEAKSLLERSQYLQEQHDDLVTALETLETAMQKIDRETRALFKDTYDRVNEGLNRKFRRLFGGGEARLELTGEDLLDTGVAIMARPPGKRLSTIHLMSGGEKALTAVALVFAIFELNPAPFCMLDEVDAPLDEANVGRFCSLVEEMAERIQFIFITHNKTTMAMAQQLIGVTMHEPGVSRLVSVDIDAAVELVEA